MAGAVSHIGDLLGIGLAICARAQFIKQSADGLDDLNIGLLVPAAHVVGITELASLQHTTNCTAMVTHIEPVADLHTVTVDWQ